MRCVALLERDAVHNISSFAIGDKTFRAEGLSDRLR